MIRAVGDPSVLVSAFLGRPDAGPGRLIAAWRDQRFTLVVSPLCWRNLPAFSRALRFERWPSNGRAAAYVAGFAAGSEHRPDHAAAEPTVRDPRGGTLAGLGVSERVARSRELVAQGRSPSLVARVARISRQALYRVRRRPPRGQRRPLDAVDRAVLDQVAPRADVRAARPWT